jgi:hypothetical protein
MKLLLDTHVFLWFISADAQLPPEWRDRIPQSTISRSNGYNTRLRACLLMKPVSVISPHCHRYTATRLTACWCVRPLNMG